MLGATRNAWREKFWARAGLFLTIELKFYSKTNTQYWSSSLANDQKKTDSCQAPQLNKRVQLTSFQVDAKMLRWNLSNNWPRYYFSSSQKSFFSILMGECRNRSRNDNLLSSRNEKEGLEEGGGPDPAFLLLFHDNPASRTVSSSLSRIPFFLLRKIH